jgi:phenylalanyl-tRNA synthetase alpha chain
MTEFDTLQSQLLADVADAADEPAIEAVRLAALGKKGSVSELLKTLGSMSPEERQTRGAAINALKTVITDAIGSRKAELKDAAITAKLKAETVDVSLPVRSSPAG